MQHWSSRCKERQIRVGSVLSANVIPMCSFDYDSLNLVLTAVLEKRSGVQHKHLNNMNIRTTFHGNLAIGFHYVMWKVDILYMAQVEWVETLGYTNEQFQSDFFKMIHHEYKWKLGAKNRRNAPAGPRVSTPSKISCCRYIHEGKKGLNSTRVLWADLGQFIQAALSSEKQFHLRDLFGN